METTAPMYCEFNTGPDYIEEALRKNDKINGIICSSLHRREDTSRYEDRVSLDDFFSCGTINIIDSGRILPLTAGIEWLKIYDNIFDLYRHENLDNDLNINEFFIKEYEPNKSMNILHSLMDIGSEIFKDARPSNTEETKIVKNFVRSKSKIISSKKL